MIVRDWRDLPADLIAPLYDRERRCWLRELLWDPTPAWGEVERGRTLWGLPGLVAFGADGEPCGLTFFVREGERMDVGGLMADAPEATRALLEGVMDAARRERVAEVHFFAFAGAPSLASELEMRGFDIARYDYLRRSLLSGTAPTSPVGYPSDITATSWREGDTERVASLLRVAYDPSDGRVFAPHHQREEWERYVGNLVRFGACGTLCSSGSRVLVEAGVVRGAAIVTVVAPHTAHVAQFAIDPMRRNQGLGRAMLEDVCQTVSRLGFHDLTLMVASENGPALAVYHKQGFRGQAEFLSARVQPRRLTSVAPVGVGAITRR